MYSIDFLQNFNPRNKDLETMIAVAESLKTLASGYEARAIEIPEWITEKVVDCETEISSMVRAERLANLKKLKARRASLATNEEKRKSLDDDIARAEAILSGGNSPS